jgi:hypothetical protein
MRKAMLWGRSVITLGVVVTSLTIVAARGENLDAGKSAPKLFADSCVACHRSARGLTKGRFRLSLYLFLQQHYASNSSAAWELASYLESVDEVPKGRPRGGAPKHTTTLASKSGSALRPPAPIPQQH